MKLTNDKKYLYWGLTAFLVIAFSIAFYYLVFHFQQVTDNIITLLKILMPFIDGLVIAFLFTPIITYLETKIFKVQKLGEKAQKRVRALTCLLTLIGFLALIYIFLYSIIPELSESLSNITTKYPEYEKNVTDFADNFLKKYPELNDLYNQNISEITKKTDTYISENLLPKLSEGIMSLTGSIMGAVRAVLDFIIGLIIAFYAMYNKEKFSGQCKKVCYALMRRSTANGFIHNMRFTGKTFQNFIIGKLCDSIIIGLICFIVMRIFNLKYLVLISVIIGITNMIPLFGPFIGAIPSIFLLFVESPSQAFTFLIIIIILQQFDGNILGPKILGSSTGLSGFWVIFAITVFGGWLGVVGWLVGVPIFAVIYSGFKSYVNARLTDKNLSTNTDKYITVNYIDDAHHYIKIPKEDVKELSSFKDNSILSFISSKFTKDSDDSLDNDKNDNKANENQTESSENNKVSTDETTNN